MIRSRTLANDQSSSQTINITALTYSILNQLKNGLDTKTFNNVVLDQATIGANTAGTGSFTSLTANSNVVFKGTDGSSFTWAADGSLLALTSGTIIRWSDSNTITSSNGQLSLSDNVISVGTSSVQPSDNGIYLSNSKIFIGSGIALNQASIDQSSNIGNRLVQIKTKPLIQSTSTTLPSKNVTGTQLGNLELNFLFPTTICHSYEKIDCQGRPIDTNTKQPYNINIDVQFTKIYNISNITNTWMLLPKGYSDGQFKTISCLTNETPTLPSTTQVIIQGQFWVNNGPATSYGLYSIGSSVTFNYDTTLNSWFVSSSGGIVKQ